MKGICKVIAYVNLVLGIIGSIAAAYLGGRSLDTYSRYSISYDRNWLLTIAIFLGIMLMVITLYVILMSLVELLEKQEWMESRLLELDMEEKEKDNSSQPSFKASNSKADLLRAAASQDVRKNVWVCSECGETNSAASRTCKGCGRDR